MTAGIDAWINTYHAVRSLTRQGTYVFLTDSAVGAPEENKTCGIWSRTLVTMPLATGWCRFSTAKHTRVPVASSARL